MKLSYWIFVSAKILPEKSQSLTECSSFTRTFEILHKWSKIIRIFTLIVEFLLEWSNFNREVEIIDRMVEFLLEWSKFCPNSFKFCPNSLKFSQMV